MQAAPIRPATLMMEFMATEQEKIGQGIASMEFSRQLEEQNRRATGLHHNQPSGLVKMASRSPVALESPSQADGKPRSNQEDTLHNPDDKNFRSLKSRSARTLSRKNLPMYEWRASQQLSFNNPAALDKALTELQLSPTLKEASRNAQSEKGSISLQKFSAILDRAAHGKEVLIADGKVSAADIQVLVASLQQGQQGMAEGIEQLKIKQSGYYSYDEFRQLIKRIVQQTAKEKLAQDGNAPLKNSLQANSASPKAVDSASLASSAKLSGQTQSLATNFIPSFLQEEGTKTSAPDERPHLLTSSATPEKGSVRLEVIPQHQPDGQTGLKDITSLPKHGSGAAPFTGKGTDPTALPQALKGIAGGPNTPGIEAALSRQVNAANTADLQRPTPGLSVEQNGANTAKGGGPPDSSGLKIIGAGVASSQEGIASLVNSVEGHGEAVIKSYHLDPETNKSQNHQTISSSTAGNKAATDSFMGKITAPTETSGQSTQNKQGQPGFSAFSKEGAQCLPANAPPAGATQPGSPGDGSTPGTSGLKTAMPGMAGSQRGMASLMNSVEDHGEAVIKSYHLDPETNKSQNHQTISSSAAGSKAATDSFMGKITAPTETSGQSTQNKAGQPGFSAFSKEGAQSLPANAPPAGATQPGSPGDGSTPGTSGLKTAVPGMAGSQEGMASLVNSVEDHGEAVIKSYHLDPETSKSQNHQILTSSAAGNKATTDSLMEKIATPTETSGQSTQNKQGQPGFFTFAKEGAQSLPANAPSAGATLSGTSLTQGASWPQALAEGIQELHKQKQNHLTLELESKDLGRILVRVETEQNQVRAVISTGSEQAKDLLHRSSPQLRQQLEAQGLVLSHLQIDLRQHQSERRRPNYQDHGSRRARDGASTRAAVGQDGAATLGATTPVHGSGSQIINLFA